MSPEPQLGCPTTEEVIYTTEGLQALPLITTAAGAHEVRFTARPGLYQFSVTMDASEFDWEQLYEILNKYHNVNERTGPWDFSINHGAIPLVPAYWVELNGRRLGLWFFERVSLEDLQQRRFRGKFAFAAEGPTELTLIPYRPGSAKADLAAPAAPDEGPTAPCGRAATETLVYDWSGLRWTSAVLETDPEDRFEPLPPDLQDGSAAPAARWADEAYWQGLKRMLEGSAACYREPLQAAFEFALTAEEAAAGHLLALVAAWRLEDNPAALDRALEVIDDLVARPSWGNPNPEGYSHNADMGAMYALRGLAWMVHALGEQMGPQRRQRVLEKLQRQGQTFFELALLNRDYWGGSVVQDHGWKSLFGFGTAALHLRGLIPEAEAWASYLLPRLRRSLAAMPLDGVLPVSSHQSLNLYLDEVMHYRDTLLAVGGEDLLRQPQFPPIIDFVAQVLDDERLMLRFSGVGNMPFIGGAAFFNRMASVYGDGLAAYLGRRLLDLRQSEFYHGTQHEAYYLGAVYGLLTFDPGIEPAARLPRPSRLRHFPDSGLVHYRDDDQGLVFSLRCGPSSGYNSYRASACPCDRLGVAPGQGHFSLSLDDQPLLTSPDAGYRLQTCLRSCLLLDDQGQYGDIGYPMSIPSLRDRGEQVQFVRPGEDEGFVRLLLSNAYPDSLGVVSYTRDFLFNPDRIIVRDSLVLDEPRQLSWLFQGKREYGVAVEGLTGIFGQRRRLHLNPRAVGLQLTAGLAQTPVVWSYASSSGFRPFDHVRYDTCEPQRWAVVDFILQWE